MNSSRSALPLSGDPPRALVTGASGFVGHAVCRALINAGWQVFGQTRAHAPPAGVQPVTLDLGRCTDYAGLLPRCDAIIHLAALSHVPLAHVDRKTLWRINVGATESLARMAARHDAHFVFASTAKVLGEAGEWDDAASPAPADAYAESKLAAEASLHALNGLRFTILRPPLVYGPGVKGNFLRLLRWADSGWPLPLGSLDNPRSLLYVENLAAAIATLLHSPTALGQTWLISDGEAPSVTTLFRTLAAALGRPARLLPFPARTMRRVGALFGMGGLATRLTGHFVIHDREIRQRLGWLPSHTFTAGARATAAWYRARPTPLPSARCERKT